MFLAKFNIADNKNSKFNADHNDNLPYIGTLIAGTATSSLINGTIFEREGYIAGSMYACINVDRAYTNPETNETVTVTDVVVLQPVSLLEFNELSKQLGAPKLIVKAKDDVKVVGSKKASIEA